MKIIFSDEKMFDLDGIYTSLNDHIWAVNREKANRRSGKKPPTKVFTKRYDMISCMLRGRCAPCSV